MKAKIFGLFLACSVAFPVSAGVIFDNSSRQDFQSNRSAGDSPVAAITVSSSQAINQIGVSFDPSGNGNLKFLIFNLGTSALLFSSGSQAFTDIGSGFYSSSVFANFLLDPGVTYGIGAIADVGGLWGINNSSAGNAYTQGVVTASDDLNGNVSNFASPVLGGNGTAMIIVRLSAPNAVPEPGTLALLGLGLAGLGLGRRRKA